MTDDEFFELAADRGSLQKAIRGLHSEIKDTLARSARATQIVTEVASLVPSQVRTWLDPDNNGELLVRLITGNISGSIERNEDDGCALSETDAVRAAVDRSFADLDIALRSRIVDAVASTVDKIFSSELQAFVAAGGEFRTDRYGRPQVRRPGEDWSDE